MAEKARLPCLIKSPVLYSHFIQSRPENVQFSPTGCNWAQRAIIAEPLCCKALQMNATQCNIMEYNRSVCITLFYEPQQGLPVPVRLRKIDDKRAMTDDSIRLSSSSASSPNISTGAAQKPGG